MIIAQYGRFMLCTKTYADAHEYYVRDIELRKLNTETDEQQTIAVFNKEGALTSCGNRLLLSMESEDDIEKVRNLAELARLIFEGENVKSGFVG